MKFGEAIEYLKKGKRVTRKGWNGKGMYLEMQNPDDHSKMTRSYIYMKTVNDDLVPWVASQSDMIEEDWELVKPDCFDSVVKDLGGVFNASLGLSGEVGEFNDMIKKWIFHEKKIDIDHAKKELGDIMWYVAMMAESFGWNLDEIMQMNVDKLIARFPDGFDVDRANNRSDDDV